MQGKLKSRQHVKLIFDSHCLQSFNALSQLQRISGSNSAAMFCIEASVSHGMQFMMRLVVLLRRCAKACRATKNTKRVAVGEADHLEFIYIYIYKQELPPPCLAHVASHVITRHHVCQGVAFLRSTMDIASADHCVHGAIELSPIEGRKPENKFKYFKHSTEGPVPNTISIA